MAPKAVESKFFHHKYHLREWRRGHCLFGRIEGGSFDLSYRSRYLYVCMLFLEDGLAYNNIENIGCGMIRLIVIHITKTPPKIHIHILLPVNSLTFLGTDYILFFEGERVTSHDLTTSTMVHISNSRNVNSSFSSAPFFSFGSVKCWQDFKLMLIITIF